MNIKLKFNLLVLILISFLKGCPTTFMWVYRLGAEKAKRLLLTGDLIDGKKALEIGMYEHQEFESLNRDVDGFD
jgi:enoyl-CoA hydratase/carnithine racemase